MVNAVTARVAAGIERILVHHSHMPACTANGVGVNPGVTPVRQCIEGQAPRTHQLPERDHARIICARTYVGVLGLMSSVALCSVSAMLRTRRLPLCTCRHAHLGQRCSCHR